MLFVPVWDVNPMKVLKFQYATVGVIVLNVLCFFLLETDLAFTVPAGFIDGLQVIPADVVPFSSFLAHLPEHFRLATYTFFHHDFFHLFFNMLFLFVFADNVEDAMGSFRFILFYLLCGAIAAIVYSLLTVRPDLPLIGASGAVSGVIGAYLMLHPNVRVWVLLPLPNLPYIPLRFSAAFVIGVWILYQTGNAIYFAKDATATTAWWAHVGGFAAGVALIGLMKGPSVHLFDRRTGL